MRGNALLVFFQPTQGLEIRKKKENMDSFSCWWGILQTRSHGESQSSSKQGKLIVFLHPIHFNQI